MNVGRSNIGDRRCPFNKNSNFDLFFYETVTDHGVNFIYINYRLLHQTTDYQTTDYYTRLNKA